MALNLLYRRVNKCVMSLPKWSRLANKSGRAGRICLTLAGVVY